MYTLTTYKEKLQENRKVVLDYQMATNTSLKDIDPGLTILELKQLTDKTYKGKNTYTKYHRGMVTTDINSEEELFKYKEFKLLKYLNKYDIDFSLYGTGDNKHDIRNTRSNSLIITTIINHIKKYTSYRVSVSKIKNNLYRINININERPIEIKDYIRYLKTDIKNILNYQLITSTPINKILEFKNDHTFMKNCSNRKSSLVKNLDFKSLYSVEERNMNNLIVELYFEDTDYDEDYCCTFDSVYELLKYIEKENILKNHEINSVKYYKSISDDKEWRTITINLKNKIIKKSGKIFIKDMETIESFNDYVFTHGLYAYNRFNRVEDKIKNIVNNKDIEICCAWKNEFVGPFGIFVKGDCKIASLFDLGSKYDHETGEGRFILEERLSDNWLIDNPKQIVSSNITTGEAIVTNINIVGIWVDKNYEDVDGYIDSIKQITGIGKVTIVESQYMN